uniref:Theileria-specific sub-telomeric protein, SVSP family member, putative n=1 Tax=Theileria annulata TaxID=5874 RepID=A0A3B0N296_THEAN
MKCRIYAFLILFILIGYVYCADQPNDQSKDVKGIGSVDCDSDQGEDNFQVTEITEISKDDQRQDDILQNSNEIIIGEEETVEEQALQPTIVPLEEQQQNQEGQEETVELEELESVVLEQPEVDIFEEPMHLSYYYQFLTDYQEHQPQQGTDYYGPNQPFPPVQQQGQFTQGQTSHDQGYFLSMLQEQDQIPQPVQQPVQPIQDQPLQPQSETQFIELQPIQLQIPQPVQQPVQPIQDQPLQPQSETQFIELQPIQLQIPQPVQQPVQPIQDQPLQPQSETQFIELQPIQLQIPQPVQPTPPPGYIVLQRIPLHVLKRISQQTEATTQTQPTETTKEPEPLHPETIPVEIGSDEDEEPQGPEEGDQPPDKPEEEESEEEDDDDEEEEEEEDSDRSSEKSKDKHRSRIHKIYHTRSNSITLKKKNKKGKLIPMTKRDYKWIYCDKRHKRYKLFANLEQIICDNEKVYQHKPGTPYASKITTNNYYFGFVIECNNVFTLIKQYKRKWIMIESVAPDYIKIFGISSSGKEVLLTDNEYHITLSSAESFRYTFSRGVKCCKFMVRDMIAWEKTNEKEDPLFININGRLNVIVTFKSYFCVYIKKINKYEQSKLRSRKKEFY